MAKTFAVTADHLSSSSVASTATPLTLAIWVNPTTISTFQRYLTLGASTSSSSYFSLGLDGTGGSTRFAAITSKSSQLSQARTASGPVTGSWQHLCGVFNGLADVRAYLNGANKASGTGVVPDATVDMTIISGRNPDFVGGIIGQAAHASVWTRALTDIEVAYLGAGGNPRAIKGLVSYWKIASGESPVVDQISSNNLTVAGTTAGTTDPNFQTYMTGGPVGALVYTQGTAIASINLAAGHVLDDVDSAFTVGLCQLAPATQPTTTSTSGTTTRIVPLASNSAFAAGDYLKILSGGTPARVLWVDAANNALVDRDQTFSSGALVYRQAVSGLTIAGLGLASNAFSGTPTAAAAYTQELFRGICNGNSALMADTDVNSLTINASGGGGGGSGLILPAGSFSGGFLGG